MDDLRIKAMAFALDARTGPTDDVIALAEKIFQFLRGDQVQRECATPPPIPQPLATDFSRADQTPRFEVASCC